METRELIDGMEDMGAICDINVTPFIDIMLVLLIIFMVTAPLMLGGVHVNLPKSGGEPMTRPENPLIVSLDLEGRIFVDKEEVAPQARHEHFKSLALASENGEIFVRGDGGVKYAEMMSLMSELGQAGFARVTLVTDVQAGLKSESTSLSSSGAGIASGILSSQAKSQPAPQLSPIPLSALAGER